jgi:hypothetical protein
MVSSFSYLLLVVELGRASAPVKRPLLGKILGKKAAFKQQIPLSCVSDIFLSMERVK